MAIEASPETLADCLTDTQVMGTWIWPLRVAPGAPAHLSEGDEFVTQVGPIWFGHRVEIATDRQLSLVLWGAADGWNEWRWGDDWVQLRTEAVSLLPLELGQSILLARLRAIAQQRSA